jgi:hypothetical protein
VGAVYQKVRVTHLLLLRHLRFDAALGLLVRDGVARHQPLDLNLRAAVDDDQFIKALVAARLDHQRGVNDRDASRVFRLPLAQPLVLGGDYKRVEDGI